jgi:endonuclease/exonuclease/phosphatase (EEP) superfamily protein YafD
MALTRRPVDATRGETRSVFGALRALGYWPCVSLVLVICWRLLREKLDYASQLGGLLQHTPSAVPLLLSALPLVVHCLRRNWPSAIATLAAALLGIPLLAPSTVVRPVQSPMSLKSPRTLRVMTFNVEKWSHGATAVAAAIRAEDPDVVCLQEAGDYWWMRGADENPQALFANMKSYVHEGRGEIWILSKWPIVAFQAVALAQQEGERPLVMGVVQLPSSQTRLTFGCLHLLPAHRFGGAQAPWAVTAAARATQVRDIAKSANAPDFTGSGRTQGIDLLLGDFNTPDTSTLLEPLLATHSDAWSEAGSGIGFTAPVGFPMQRIDRVLAGPAAHVQSAHIGKLAASDHYPLIVDVVVSASPAQTP